LAGQEDLEGMHFASQTEIASLSNTVIRHGRCRARDQEPVLHTTFRSTASTGFLIAHQQLSEDLSNGLLK
jgi:hypothetical protein